MPSSLPTADKFNDPSVTEGAFKANFAQMLDFLRGLLGSDGTTLTALQTIGALGSKVRVITGDTTLSADNRGELVVAGSPGITVTLPRPVGGLIFAVSAGAHSPTVDCSGHTIDGKSAIALSTGSGCTFVAVDSQWVSIGRSGQGVFFDSGDIDDGDSIPVPAGYNIDDFDVHLSAKSYDIRGQNGIWRYAQKLEIEMDQDDPSKVLAAIHCVQRQGGPGPAGSTSYTLGSQTFYRIPITATYLIISAAK